MFFYLFVDDYIHSDNIFYINFTYHFKFSIEIVTELIKMRQVYSTCHVNAINAGLVSILQHITLNLHIDLKYEN